MLQKYRIKENTVREDDMQEKSDESKRSMVCLGLLVNPIFKPDWVVMMPRTKENNKM